MTPTPPPPRRRKVRILATLGPASNTPAQIRALYEAGADAFRVNMSHGDEAARGALIDAIRSLEAEVGRPMTVLVDLQGPKLRVGKFAGGRVTLTRNQSFQLDQDPAPGDERRVQLPHPEILAAVTPGSRLLLDDGKVRLRVVEVADGRVTTRVEVAGTLSDNKGLNVPDVVLPVESLTAKDKHDLQFALSKGVDWVALSFVQRPEDLTVAREMIAGRAALLAKIEKPSALEHLPAIIAGCDGIMVARGDLGVELPPEQVPRAQKRIVALARQAGKPVVVATQMLESMIQAPTPTRAEVSDVATAIYDGADAVMLSAESAAGSFPVEAVAMMDAIAAEVEADALYEARLHFTATPAEHTIADALAEAAGTTVHVVGARVVTCFTMSGSTAIRAARERFLVPVLALTPRLETARRLGLVWGVHALNTRDVASFEEMVGKAKRMVLRTGLASGGDTVALLAGVPFGMSGSTNVLHVVKLTGDELTRDPDQASVAAS